MVINLKSLVGKLHPIARSVTEAAAGLCLARTHYEVVFVGVRMEIAEAASVAQAVQAVPFLVTPWHRFLAAFDGSSCNVEVHECFQPDRQLCLSTG